MDNKNCYQNCATTKKIQCSSAVVIHHAIDTSGQGTFATLKKLNRDYDIFKQAHTSCKDMPWFLRRTQPNLFKLSSSVWAKFRLPTPPSLLFHWEKSTVGIGNVVLAMSSVDLHVSAAAVLWQITCLNKGHANASVCED